MRGGGGEGGVRVYSYTPFSFSVNVFNLIHAVLHVFYFSLAVLRVLYRQIYNYFIISSLIMPFILSQEIFGLHIFFIYL